MNDFNSGPGLDELIPDGWLPAVARIGLRAHPRRAATTRTGKPRLAFEREKATGNAYHRLEAHTIDKPGTLDGPGGVKLLLR